MKKINLLILSLGVLVWSCKPQESVNPPKDEITILSVTPNKDLTEGQSTEFEITVRYHLINKPQGEINLGFNSFEANTDNISTPYQIVQSGAADTLVFKVTGIPKKWSSTDFHAYANLSENPHANTWKPLVSTTYKLDIK